MKMQPGMAAVDDLQDAAVVLQEHAGRESSLQADICSSPLLCLPRPAEDLLS